MIYSVTLVGVMAEHIESKQSSRFVVRFFGLVLMSDSAEICGGESEQGQNIIWD